MTAVSILMDGKRTMGNNWTLRNRQRPEAVGRRKPAGRNLSAAGRFFDQRVLGGEWLQRPSLGQQHNQLQPREFEFSRASACYCRVKRLARRRQHYVCPG